MKNSGADGPTVSVIMPTFNAADTVGDQLHALTRQTYSARWEVIICDNGSTDDTLEIAQQWAANFDWASVVDASHRRGPSAARNAGARAAGAPLLVFCDADDVVADGWLAAMVEALDQDDVVAGVVDQDSFAVDGAASVSWVTQPPITMPFWPEFTAGATNNLGIRTAVFQEIHGFDESLETGEDIDLCWRAQVAGHTFTVCDRAVVAIRKRTTRLAVFRQAFARGRGEKRLREKHRARAREYHHEDYIPQPAGVPREECPALLVAARRTIRRGIRVLTRLWVAQQQADLLWRCGYWFGLKAGGLRDCFDSRLLRLASIGI